MRAFPAAIAGLLVFALGPSASAQSVLRGAGMPPTPSMPLSGSFSSAPVGRLGTAFPTPSVPFHAGPHFPPRFPVVVIPYPYNPYPYYPFPFALYTYYTMNRQAPPAPNTIVPQISLTYPNDPPPGPPGLNALLAANGLPSAGGHIVWPLGLRLLGGSDELRRQTESLLNQLATAPPGPETAALGRQLAGLVGDWQQQLRRANERGGLTQYATDEAQGFLRRLNDLATRLTTPSNEGFTFRSR